MRIGLFASVRRRAATRNDFVRHPRGLKPTVTFKHRSAVLKSSGSDVRLLNYQAVTARCLARVPIAKEVHARGSTIGTPDGSKWRLLRVATV